MRRVEKRKISPKQLRTRVDRVKLETISAILATYTTAVHVWNWIYIIIVIKYEESYSCSREIAFGRTGSKRIINNT